MTHETGWARPGSMMRRAGAYWGLLLTYGLVTLALGVILAVWPGETLAVLAVLVGIQLIVSGCLRLATAITADELDGGVRAVIGLLGGLGVVVGLLCLRDPVQTVLVLGILLGVWWVASGFVDIIGAVLSPASGRMIWDAVMGLLSVVAGGFLLIHPDLSLGIFVVVACVWLIGTGLFAIVAAFVLRRERTQSAAVGAADLAS